ncbi:MAG: ribbon-helix-helix domain-containing protein [Rhizonema sp. PD37]|nr:ribbon-helix-helix domain-containing protein [Rhizonema sp. PD37]
MNRPKWKQTVTVRIDQQHIDQLGHLASQEGVARCAFLRKVVEEYLCKKNHTADKSLAA